MVKLRKLADITRIRWRPKVMKISGTEIEVTTNPYNRSAAPIDNEYEYAIPSLLIKGRWQNKILDYIRKKNIKGLYLNYAKGFQCDSFDFLTQLDDLEMLHIVYTPVQSLSQIEQLVNLKALSISCHWKDKLDLSNLGNLQRCFLGYDKGADSIFNCRSLRYLYIDEFKLKSFEQLESLEKLEYLTIGNASFNEPEITGSLKKLRKLVFLNCRKLDHLNGLEQLNNLEWLTIDGSKKIESINELSSLKQLSVLQLSNNKTIASLSPIKGLKQLRALCFFGDTVISDGDFEFLEDFDALSMVGFSGRHHYTHKPARTWSWHDYESKEKAILRK